MMNNGKTVRDAMRQMKKPVGETNPYKNDVLYTNLGQWKYPGQITRIPSGDITMQGVPYPVYGEDDLGYGQMMYPGMDYTFPGQYVTEYPMVAYGGDPSLPNITGHYPFGGMYSKTHTHMQDGGWLDELDEEYRRGGSLYTPPKLKKKSKKYGTSKNIQSSINYLFTRNYDLFGPSGRTRYNPNSKYQVGGNKIDMSKVKMDYFPKSQADAQSMLDYEKFYYNQLDRELENEKQKYVAAAVKKGVPKKLAEAQVHEMLNYQEGKNQDSFQEYEPQGKLSKTIEVLANPMLAMKNYRGGRLPDYFSTNEEEDFLSPTNVSNMGYQFLTSLGNFGWGLQSADAVDRDLKNNDYQSAAIDAAFSLPALKQAKKWQKELNTIDKAKNSNAIRNAQTNTESSTIDDAVKAIKNKIAQQKVDTYNALQKLKADRPKPSMGQNKFLSGERKYSKEERDFISKNPPTSSGYYNKPSDPYYLFDFKVNPARPLEEIVAPYKKKHGGWLDYLD